MIANLPNLKFLMLYFFTSPTVLSILQSNPHNKLKQDGKKTDQLLCYISMVETTNYSLKFTPSSVVVKVKVTLDCQLWLSMPNEIRQQFSAFLKTRCGCMIKLRPMGLNVDDVCNMWMIFNLKHKPFAMEFLSFSLVL